MPGSITFLNAFFLEHPNHQHLILLGAMNAIVHNQETTIQKGHKLKQGWKPDQHTCFEGLLCVASFFRFVFSCGEKRLKNVRKKTVSE